MKGFPAEEVLEYMLNLNRTRRAESEKRWKTVLKAFESNPEKSVESNIDKLLEVLRR